MMDEMNVETSTIMYQQKKELQDQIKSTLKRQSHRLKKPTLTVALIGTIGVGKSSFINTIATAMSNDRWREHALTGHHGGEATPLTAYTKRYPQCCREEEHQNPLIPTLMDIGGLPNQMDEYWQEVLNMVFYGRVPERENLLNVHEYLKTKEDIRRSRYDKTYSHLKVDRVVVVGSATQEVPENLLKIIVRAARPLQGSNKISIPIFGVMTKYDLVDKKNEEKFQQREKLFKDLLGLTGAETRYLRCSNYCSGTDPGNKRIRINMPNLDLPVLRLLTQICDPVIEADNEEQEPRWRELLRTEDIQQWIIWASWRFGTSPSVIMGFVFTFICLTVSQSSHVAFLAVVVLWISYKLLQFLMSTFMN